MRFELTGSKWFLDALALILTSWKLFMACVRAQRVFECL